MPLSWIEIDLAALRHNLNEIRGRLSPGTKIMAVVKSDAYGHGLIPISLELQKMGVEFFGVSRFQEAVALIEAQIKRPILVLLGIEDENVEEIIHHNIRCTLYRIDQARRLSRAAQRLAKPARVHIKIDTGMGRLGIPVRNFQGFLEELSQFPGIEIEGIFSHFSAAETDIDYTRQQLDAFQQCLNTLSSRDIHIPYAHICNSAALLELPQAHYQLVRPGLLLYGSSPFPTADDSIKLTPVMSLKSRIIQLKEVPKGQAIGYNRSYITERTSLIATIPLGYDDGYPRSLSNRSQVLIGGRRAPVVGLISMNMITVDVTGIPGLHVDQQAVLLGAQGKERIRAEELASLCNTVTYEIYCSLGRHKCKLFINAS